MAAPAIALGVKKKSFEPVRDFVVQSGPVSCNIGFPQSRCVARLFGGVIAVSIRIYRYLGFVGVYRYEQPSLTHLTRSCSHPNIGCVCFSEHSSKPPAATYHHSFAVRTSGRCLQAVSLGAFVVRSGLCAACIPSRYEPSYSYLNLNLFPATRNPSRSTRQISETVSQHLCPQRP